MRASDEEVHPEAVVRLKREGRRMWAGLVIAGCGLASVFVLHEVYVGFFVALVGAGLLPIDKALELVQFWKRP